MTINDLRESLKDAAAPPDISPLLQALWWDAKGDWTRAHEIAQDVDSSDGAWIHAYLHRKDGDTGNAGYWYGQAGKPHPRHSSEAEWEEIAQALLSR